MKKLLFTVLLFVSTALVASQTLNKESVNQVFEEILASFQSQHTKIGLNVSELETDDESLSRAKLRAWLYKQGQSNTFDFHISQFEYDYVDKQNPLLKLNASLDLDFIKYLGQDLINELLTDVETYLNQLGSLYLEEYGDAAQTEIVLKEKLIDKEGNYQALNMEIKLDIDLNKLPNNLDRSKVELKQASAIIKMTPYNVFVDLVLKFNPQYQGYVKDVKGLKSYLEDLVNRDPDTLSSIEELATDLLRLVDETLKESP